ncbi:ergothioneine biosynthesis protein EgtC [Microlunatus soli]|uniref:Gamma-glutamyl-hercynylcysteine sulfoxide hydrolase n=1 Tax=Microlunatus soli TaxID=630515 RepID=A0A1H1NDW5_9ACTN|nr:ergothioneine biosynthesis protein EgtC [Microlunatus soli]SDR97000.1 glutamine amidotransferase [Microlunatus soli]
MCRHLAWLGAPRTLSSLITEPEYGLLRQSYAPRQQRHGLLNADGWGVGFLDDTGTVRRWRSPRPLWNDASFASIAPVLSSGCVLAAVRSATVGMPPDETAAAPFTDGRWLFSHNGRVALDAVPTSSAAESIGDSAQLAAHIFDTGVEHLAETLAKVAAADPDARLTVLLTDGSRILGVAWDNELCYRQLPDGVVVASEPYDDERGWVSLADHHMIEVSDAGIMITDLESAN